MATLEALFTGPFYSVPAVTAAVEAFGPFGTFSHEVKDEAVHVTAELDDKDGERVWGEFLNYVLINSYEESQ
jgi:hypothetical protein